MVTVKHSSNLNHDVLVQAETQEAAKQAVLDFRTNFRPDPVVVEWAAKYAKDYALGCVYIPVSFPGKKPGEWISGQERNTVFDPGPQFRFWVSRQNGLDDLDFGGKYGNALFRVWKNGLVELVEEMS